LRGQPFFEVPGGHDLNVVDSQAVGRLYASPVSLARFEENAGSTNSSTLRLECHALFNTERIAAAVRIADE
jgi:hypothetical protein